MTEEEILDWVKRHSDLLISIILIKDRPTWIIRAYIASGTTIMIGRGDTFEEAKNLAEEALS